MGSDGGTSVICSGKEWLDRLLEREKVALSSGMRKGLFLARATVIIDAIWRWRNEKMFSNVIISKEEQIRRVRHWFKEIEISQESPTPICEVPSGSARAWQPPCGEAVKINVDAAYRDERAAVGMVARNSGGTMLWMWRNEIEAESAMEAEMIGVHLAVLVAKFRNVRRLVVEGDNKQIMESLSLNRDCPDWSLSPLFEQIRCAEAGLDKVVFNWVPRDESSACFV